MFHVNLVALAALVHVGIFHLPVFSCSVAVTALHLVIHHVELVVELETPLFFLTS